jgi:hypothetical protein
MNRDGHSHSFARRKGDPPVTNRRGYWRFRLPRTATVVLALLIGCAQSPQTPSESSPGGMTPQERVQSGQYDIENMTSQEMAAVGEVIVFGRLTGGNPTSTDVGKGLCPLCHTVAGDVPRNAAPNLTANEATGLPIAKRGEVRIRDPRYIAADFAQSEARPGSGRARTGLEYIAESHVCPSCYVVAGFGVKGSGDRESPMVALFLPPNCQTIDEAIMVDTYLFMKDGIEPPPPGAIRAAYEKFLPPSEPVPPGCRP